MVHKSSSLHADKWDLSKKNFFFFLFLLLALKPHSVLVVRAVDRISATPHLVQHKTSKVNGTKIISWKAVMMALHSTANVELLCTG